jgi:aminoglycoside phosphotransferase (APT) family kinase protein
MGDVEKKHVRKAALSFTEIGSVSDISKYNSGRAKETFLVETPSGNYVIYICADTSESYEERFSKEEKLLEMINEATDIPTHSILKSDLSKEKIPYLFYISREIDGYDPIDRFKWLPREEKKDIVYQAGKYLGKLHRETSFSKSGELREEDGEIRTEGLSWKDYLGNWTEKYAGDFEGTPFEGFEQDALDFFEKHSELAENGDNVCLHFDVTPDNIIVNDSGIEALIDWEKAISGRPEWDLGYARIQMIYRWFDTEEIQRELEEELFNGYFEENELADGWRKRLVYFNTIWNLKPIANFEKHFEDATEQEKKEEIEFFRQLMRRNFEDLESATEEEILY